MVALIMIRAVFWSMFYCSLVGNPQQSYSYVVIQLSIVLPRSYGTLLSNHLTERPRSPTNPKP